MRRLNVTEYLVYKVPRFSMTALPALCEEVKVLRQSFDMVRLISPSDYRAFQIEENSPHGVGAFVSVRILSVPACGGLPQYRHEDGACGRVSVSRLCQVHLSGRSGVFAGNGLRRDRTFLVREGKAGFRRNIAPAAGKLPSHARPAHGLLQSPLHERAFSLLTMCGKRKRADRSFGRLCSSWTISRMSTTDTAMSRAMSC